ncbi:MAG: hypothetical protein M0031_04825 [Thermaerobacter sp.]|nr:hypothetical protein [Thermaerobacter sp.]
MNPEAFQTLWAWLDQTEDGLQSLLRSQPEVPAAGLVVELLRLRALATGADAAAPPCGHRPGRVA